VLSISTSRCKNHKSLTSASHDPPRVSDALEECRRSAGTHLCPDAVRWLGELYDADGLGALDDE
jgi:hypothetical protein